MMKKKIPGFCALVLAASLAAESFAAAPEVLRASSVEVTEAMKTLDGLIAPEAELTPDVPIATEAKKPARVRMKIAKSSPYVIVKWKPLKKNCKGYEVWYSAKKKFPKNNRTIEQCGPTVDHLSIPLGQGRLFIKMRAFNYKKGKFYYGRFTKKKKVRLK